MESPDVVRVSLLEGHVSPREADGAELAAVTTERWFLAPGVRRTHVRHGGVVGTLFLPPGEFCSVRSGRERPLTRESPQAQVRSRPCWICGGWVEGWWSTGRPCLHPEVTQACRSPT